MLPFFGTTAIVIATFAAPTAPASSDAVRAAQPAAAVTTTTTTAAADASKRGARQQQAISTGRPAQPTDEQVIRQQLELRVIMPPLSGDGGGG
jgi:parvulin-like peptidyl-prolyl isomerase